MLDTISRKGGARLYPGGHRGFVDLAVWVRSDRSDIYEYAGAMRRRINDTGRRSAKQMSKRESKVLASRCTVVGARMRIQRSGQQSHADSMHLSDDAVAAIQRTSRWYLQGGGVHGGEEGRRSGHWYGSKLHSDGYDWLQRYEASLSQRGRQGR